MVRLTPDACTPSVAEMPQAEAHEQVQPLARHPNALLAVLLGGVFMANMDITIVNVAAPAIRADLEASGAEIELVIAGYVLAYAMLLITGARLGDSHGRRRVFLIGLGSFTVASLICGVATDVIALIAARVAQGAGAALMVAQVLAAIQVHFAGPGRVRALGLYPVALSGSAVAGQVLSGVLVSADLLDSGWRPVFLLNVPIGAGALAAGLRYLPVDVREGPARRLDLAGLATLSAALLLALLPLVLGPGEGWPAWSVISLVGALPALWAFVVVERRASARGGSPLLNLEVLRPTVSWALGAQGAAVGTYFALLFVLALYLQEGLGYGALASGLTLVAWVAAFGLAGPLTRRLPARVSSRAAPLGSSVMALAYAAIALAVLAGHHDGALLIALLGVGGFGLGTAFSARLTHLMTAVPGRYAADISGVFTTTSQLAGAVGVALFGTAYLQLAGSASDSAVDAFTVVVAGFALAAALAAAMDCLASRAQARPSCPASVAAS